MSEQVYEELLETGKIVPIVPEEETTVQDLLDSFKIESYFAIIVNDKPAGPDTVINPQDKLVIIPAIAGG
jgi:sulfur carrier protein ThiS